MSAHVTSMRDALYEAPGPKTRRLTIILTSISLLLVAIGIGLVVWQFYQTGQLDAKYWEFFLKPSTWRFLGEGFLGTVKVALTSGAIALVLGVLAEVFRAGVNAVPKGQTEAALSIGLTKGKIMFKIILPQALRIVIPSLISQLVVVVKDTTVAYVVSYPDLLQNARVLITKYDALVSVYFVIAIIYILVNYAINELSISVSRRMGQPIISRTSENPL